MRARWGAVQDRGAGSAGSIGLHYRDACESFINGALAENLTVVAAEACTFKGNGFQKAVWFNLIFGEYPGDDKNGGCHTDGFGKP